MRLSEPVGSRGGRPVNLEDTPHLPAWVYDMVILIEEHESVHGEDDHCVAHVLKLVPPVVVDRAMAIRSYKKGQQS